jgi:hypothetical protein
MAKLCAKIGGQTAQGKTKGVASTISNTVVHAAVFTEEIDLHVKATYVKPINKYDKGGYTVRLRFLEHESGNEIYEIVAGMKGIIAALKAADNHSKPSTFSPPVPTIEKLCEHECDMKDLNYDDDDILQARKQFSPGCHCEACVQVEKCKCDECKAAVLKASLENLNTATCCALCGKGFFTVPMGFDNKVTMPSGNVYHHACYAGMIAKADNPPLEYCKACLQEITGGMIKIKALDGNVYHATCYKDYVLNNLPPSQTLKIVPKEAAAVNQ